MDMEELTVLLPYIFSMGVIWAVYGVRRSKHSRKNRSEWENAKAAGLTEPASLHPVIDQAKCIGCGSCVDACPEKKVLGLINGKTALINPTLCIGHGACREACPTQSITLVFGTEKRGLDIPLVSPTFETNVPGIFIAGELGGMGLIRNAVTQGAQAISSIQKLRGIGQEGKLDVVIVGAGPAGLAAALAAKEGDLKYTVLEQDSLGGAISHYPRGKLVMTAPTKLPIVGKLPFKETSKEELMEFWEKTTSEQKLDIRFHQRVEDITTNGEGFIVKTGTNKFTTRAVLLAIGRRGTPRKLGVAGEELAKVVYRLVDPEQYRNRHVLIVGGGDSALEAACSIAEEPGTTVTISYRSNAFSRAKQKNRERVAQKQKDNKINILLNSTVSEINELAVILEQQGKKHVIRNDSIIVCAGGILPTHFLKRIGIEVETKFGTE